VSTNNFFKKTHKIYTEAKDLIQLMLRANPDDRPSCKAILKHPWFKGPVKQPAMACFVVRFPASRLLPLGG